MSYQILTMVKNVNLKKICSMYLMIFKGGKNALLHFFDTGHRSWSIKLGQGQGVPN